MRVAAKDDCQPHKAAKKQPKVPIKRWTCSGRHWRGRVSTVGSLNLRHKGRVGGVSANLMAAQRVALAGVEVHQSRVGLVP